MRSRAQGATAALCASPIASGPEAGHGPAQSNVRAVILAGGLGTRLRPVIGDLPKALAPVQGRPFLAYQLELLKGQGITRIVLCTGYGHDLIQAYCGDGAALGQQILYSVEEQPLGTGGALQQARRYLHETFLVLNGDTYFVADLHTLLASHRRGGAPATLALVKVPPSPAARPQQAARFGAVTLDAQGHITCFAEKRRRSTGLINAGIYVFEPEIWAHFPRLVPPSPAARPQLSLENDVFPLLAEQRLLRGHVLEGYHMDIGTPESYAQFQQDMVLRLTQDG